MSQWEIATFACYVNSSLAAQVQEHTLAAAAPALLLPLLLCHCSGCRCPCPAAAAAAVSVLPLPLLAPLLLPPLLRGSCQVDRKVPHNGRQRL